MTKEVAVNLNLPRDVEVGLAVRQQLSTDLPATDAPPTSVRRTVLPTETPAAAPAVAVRTDVPATPPSLR